MHMGHRTKKYFRDQNLHFRAKNISSYGIHYALVLETETTILIIHKAKPFYFTQRIQEKYLEVKRIGNFLEIAKLKARSYF